MADATPAPGRAAAVPSRRRAVWGWLGLAVLLVTLCMLVPAGRHLWQERQRVDLGERLLRGVADGERATDADGAAPVLHGRLAGHASDLPPQATRCVNCHAAGGAAASPATAAFGPSLGPATLTRAVSRRGGPPSRYDAASLCRLLRDGIDPAWVMVDAAMPRYAVSDAQCEALWARLSSPSRS
ncbi:hypothetical protein [Variovorax sp. PvP013]|uniref:hypothetical protein n=1 Tax=Variovorax sp. PvP013 TaxID=3156435 RepID=UPI003D246125